MTPKLPESGRRNILITSALPYVNNVPHLGNLIGCVLSADVYSRFCRLRGHNSLYICGTDEYGTATETKALAEGLTPQQICDKYHVIHKNIYDWFDIEFDHFGRTTTPQQTEIAQDIFRHIEAKDCIVEKDVEQLYCEKCAKSLADRFVEGTCPDCHSEGCRGDQCDACGHVVDAIKLGNPKCMTCSSSPIVKTSQHLFLALPKVVERLDKWVDEAAEKGDWSPNALATTKAWIKKGLEDRCITRDLKWGTPVPRVGYENKVFYVWFDAPIGYLSITKCYTEEWEKWWKNQEQVDLVQFMGKDNVPFHTVIFPSSLIAAQDDYTLLHHVSTTEYLNYENDKFSKSRSKGVFGNDCQETNIPSEVWRYYLLINRPESSDTQFLWSDLMQKNNSELLANVGNYCQRALMFCQNFFERRVPVPELNEKDKDFVAQQCKLVQQYVEELEAVKIKAALKTAMAISSNGNVYLQDNKPWELAKTDIKRCGTVIGVAVNLVKLLATLLIPYMPSLSRKICKQINVEMDTLDMKQVEFSLDLPEDHHIDVIPKQGLVRKLAVAEIKALKEKFSGVKPGAVEMPVELLVGRVAKIEDHPSKDNSWVISADLGKHGSRQIVSNIRTSCTGPEELLGKNVVLLTNIKKSKLGGVNSQCLLLTAPTTSPDRVVPLTCDNSVAPGTAVAPAGVKVAPVKNFKFKKEFAKLNLTVNADGAVCFGEKALPLEASSAAIKAVTDVKETCPVGF